MGCSPIQKEKHTFSIGDKTFLLDGKPFLIKAAEMHYTRIPAEYWEHRIQMCKALGMNTICIYAFWNIHEQKEGEFDFKGQNDIAAFCRLAQKHGMYIMLRPGPYVCSEWEMGGLPWWLLKKKDIKLRTNDAYFLERTKLFMNEIGKELADLQVSRGGNIIMVQVENEYGAYATDKEYIANIRDIVKGAGFTDVPLFQCDWSSTFQRNGLDDLVWTINFGTGANIDAQFKKLQEARPNAPLMCSEFWSGWFDHWGRKHETRDAETMVSGIKDMLDRHISFSLYMTHGGTTFGHWGGANSPAYSAMCSSYDYDAPISEAGWATPKYYKLREMMQYADSAQVIPDVPAAYPVIEIPEFELKEVAPLFDNLPEPKLSEDIKPMEQFDQGWGTILYRTSLPEVKEGTTLLIDEVHDWAQVYADGKLLGRLDRRRGQNSLVLPSLQKGTRLDILVEAMGRVNFDVAIHDRKGITNKVELLTETDKKELKNWEVYSFPVDYDFAESKKYAEGEKLDAPAYYRATFELDRVGDVFLDMQTWGKGMVWVNGKAMGRFWKIGPQQTLFMPGCWLKKGKNEIIVLDLLGPEKATVSGLKKPILDMLRAEAPATHRTKGQNLNLKGEKSVAVGELTAGNGWQEVKFGKTVAGRYFCLEALSAQDGKDNAAVAEFYLLDENGKPLPRQHWKIEYADSESTSWGNFTADKIYDLQESTYWSTRDGDKYPHRFVINLGEDVKVSGFRYLPRAEESYPGMIKKYKAYVKSTPFNF
ncbi:beta-galactosidase [Phocaeicola massiliensis]|uniref:beta-galactosidase n=1 Tax=Phocaeicola massiliensis TaxID=204516 RepID=UPI00192358E3|nr:beta-galactosidase [Phocaeicola massiliensis]